MNEQAGGVGGHCISAPRAMQCSRIQISAKSRAPCIVDCRKEKEFGLKLGKCENFVLTFREAIVRQIKDFFVKSLHKMETPPSPFYEVPNFLFFRQFFERKKDDFEGCLKDVAGCFVFEIISQKILKFNLRNDGFPFTS